MRADPILEAMAELDEIARRVEATRHHLADAIVTMADRRDLEGRDLGRMTAPSGEIAGVPCSDPCYRVEREQNARPETHTHDVALDPDDVEALDRCGE